jgi:DNA-directed RNA polymerase specialized sigma24 family protein
VKDMTDHTDHRRGLFVKAPDIAPSTFRAMARAWRALPERDRAIFGAVRFEGLDYVEVARRHGCRPREVERVIARVLVALARADRGPDA